MEDYKDAVMQFVEAQQTAEKKKEHDFKCPLCGGSAHWERSAYNNHLCTSCDDCHFIIME